MGRIGLAFLAGHCVVHGLASLPSLFPYAFVLAAMLALALYFRVAWVSAFLVGIAWAWLNAGLRLAEDLPAALEGQDVLVHGYVASLPDAADTDPQFELDVVARAVQGIPPRIRLSWYESDQIPAPGELWQFVVRLKRRSGFANPGGFDYEGQLFRSGIGATGYVRNDSRNLRLSGPSAKYAVLRVRAWLAQRIAQATAKKSHLGILQGLAVGDTQAMQPDQWRVFAATGTTHLMAISGLHISMIAALFAWCGGSIIRLRGAQRRRWTAVHGQALAGAVGAVCYSCLAGLSVPTQRTLMMLCIYFAARWWRRELSVANALSVALIGVLLLDPFAPLAVGAWLSFGAVAIILLALGGRLRRDGTLLNFTRVQWAVTIGMAPLLIGAFSSLSLISPLVNAVAIPLFTLVLVPVVLVGAAAAAVSLPVGSLILGGVAWLIAWCWPGLEWLASLANAVWYFPALTSLTFVALLVGATLLVAPVIWPLRLLAVLLCLPAIVNRPTTPSSGAFELVVLDVGQGLAVTVRTRQHTLVYDTGPAFRTGRDTGELVVLPFLRGAGVRQIDTLMVSHDDLDHTGGMQSLLTGMPTRALFVGPSIKSMPRRGNTGYCRRGQRWQWDGVDFEVLHPGSQTYAGDNDSSCVLRVSGPGGSALLTGDSESGAENAFVQNGLPRTDVVVVAHHGSRSSSTAGLIEAARAQLALFSAGYRNRWGFPKVDVMRRWQASGARTMSTIDSGAIAITVDTHGVRTPQEYRVAHRHYWSAR